MNRCIIDAGDVNRIVINSPLAEIDKEILTSKAMIETTEGYVQSYWEERLDALELARDISEWCFENSIPTVTSKETKDYRIIEILGLIKDMEGKLDYTYKKLQSHIDKKYKKDIY